MNLSNKKYTHSTVQGYIGRVAWQTADICLASTHMEKRDEKK